MLFFWIMNSFPSTHNTLDPPLQPTNCFPPAVLPISPSVQILLQQMQALHFLSPWQRVNASFSPQPLPQWRRETNRTDPPHSKLGCVAPVFLLFTFHVALAVQTCRFPSSFTPTFIPKLNENLLVGKTKKSHDSVFLFFPSSEGQLHLISLCSRLWPHILDELGLLQADQTQASLLSI